MPKRSNRTRTTGLGTPGLPSEVGLYTHYRNLYQRVSLPDNFTGSDFFASCLQINPILKHWNRSDAILKASRVTLQYCVSILFFVSYYHLSAQTLKPETVLPISILTTFIGYFIYQIYPLWPYRDGFINLVKQLPTEHVKLAIIYLIFSYALAPILRTLTDTVSTDTIHATSLYMLCVHLVTCEYGVSAFLVSKTTSVNAAVIGSIFLASRMATDLHSLTLLTLAVESFVLFPVFSVLIWDSKIILFGFIFVGSLSCFSISFTILYVFLLAIFCISIVFPLLFVACTRSKSNIYGPWDEATVKLHSHLKSL